MEKVCPSKLSIIFATFYALFSRANAIKQAAELQNIRPPKSLGFAVIAGPGHGAH